MESLKRAGYVLIQFPDARLGEVRVSRFEKRVAVEFTCDSGDLVKDPVDQLSPPIFVIVRSRAIQGGTGRHLFPTAQEGVIENCCIEFEPDLLRDQRVMMTNAF
jgi:hypothetical protein